MKVFAAAATAITLIASTLHAAPVSYNYTADVTSFASVPSLSTPELAGSFPDPFPIGAFSFSGVLTYDPDIVPVFDTISGTFVFDGGVSITTDIAELEGFRAGLGFTESGAATSQVFSGIYTSVFGTLAQPDTIVDDTPYVSVIGSITLTQDPAVLSADELPSPLTLGDFTRANLQFGVLFSQFNSTTQGQELLDIKAIGANITSFVPVAQAAPIAPVPLPASLPLLLAGVGGLGLMARRRRKAA